MEKEKQIEEMALDVWQTGGIDLEIAGAIAIDLYEQGYRKERQGEWKKIVKVRKDGTPLLYHYQCSLCGVYIGTPVNYCGNCGAKMKGAE